MATLQFISPSKPGHINPVQWQQSIAIARQASARVFRDGGTPAEAARAFGIDLPSADWSKVVEAIAELLCASPVRKAA